MTETKLIDRSKWKGHPNSNKNLIPFSGNNDPVANQKKSAAARRFNTEKRKELELMAKDFKRFAKANETEDMPNAIDFMRFYMLECMNEGKLEDAFRVAQQLAEFEAPKLTRVDQTNTNVEAGDMTDDELAAKLKKLREKP